MSMVLITLGLALGASQGAYAAQAQTPPTQEKISCRVIESKTSSTLGVKLIVFHHAEAASRERLSAFLENHDGGSVEFQTEGSDWQPATVFRLKSCFGRGLLVFPVGSGRLAPWQTFLMRATGRSH